MWYWLRMERFGGKEETVSLLKRALIGRAIHGNRALKIKTESLFWALTRTAALQLPFHSVRPIPLRWKTLRAFRFQPSFSAEDAPVWLRLFMRVLIGSMGFTSEVKWRPNGPRPRWASKAR